MQSHSSRGWSCTVKICFISSSFLKAGKGVTFLGKSKEHVQYYCSDNKEGIISAVLRLLCLLQSSSSMPFIKIFRVKTISDCTTLRRIPLIENKQTYLDDTPWVSTTLIRSAWNEETMSQATFLIWNHPWKSRNLHSIESTSSC